MRLLIVGGAGYIGSHMLCYLSNKKVDVTVLDNLSTGYSDSVVYGTLVKGDLADFTLLDNLFASVNFDAVIHFASFIQVGESVVSPSKYYQNNLVNTLNLLNVMVKHGVSRLVFSSTAAIFGNPIYLPIDEKHEKAPINPYGKSKLMIEKILEDYDVAYGLKSISLRYFNAAGADPKGRVGERHVPETHLIPLVLRVANKKMPHIKVYGTSHPTHDGTCIRDYIHVEDLSQAHWLSVNSLMAGSASRQYNLGNGNGFSVLDVINIAEEVTGRKIPFLEAEKREGDPAVLIADSNQIRKELLWKPKYQNLSTIIEHAWSWESTGGL